VLFSAPIALVPGVAAAPSGDSAHAGGGDSVAPASASVTVTRDGPETVRYEVALTNLSRTDRLWVVVGGAEVRTATGLTRTGGDGRTRLRWTGADVARVTLAVSVDADRARPERAATDAWAFGPVPFVEVQREVDGSVARSWPLTGDSVAGDRRLDGGRHVVGDRYALVGDHDVRTAAAAGQRFRLVMPVGAGSTVDAPAVLDALAGAAREFHVGDRDERVLAFAAPDPVRDGGESVPARDEFWVDADASLDSPENVWIHEYVHTRQSFSLAPEMRWFREASAEYYAARLSYEQGLVSRSAMRDSLDGSASAATLTDPASWPDRQTPHEKGARALAVLDSKIRDASLGHRSLEDVFRRLNSHDGTVTYAVFARTVAAVAGQPMDEWLDRHVAGDAPVTDDYRQSPLAAVGLPALDRLGSTPGTAFFLVALALSLLASGPLYAVIGRLQRREQRDGDRDDDGRGGERHSRETRLLG